MRIKRYRQKWHCAFSSTRFNNLHRTLRAPRKVQSSDVEKEGPWSHKQVGSSALPNASKKNHGLLLALKLKHHSLGISRLARRKRLVCLSQCRRQWGTLEIRVLSSSILSGLQSVSSCYQAPSHKRVHPSKQDRLCGCHHKNTQAVLIPRKPGVSFYTQSSCLLPRTFP